MSKPQRYKVVDVVVGPANHMWITLDGQEERLHIHDQDVEEWALKGLQPGDDLLITPFGDSINWKRPGSICKVQRVPAFQQEEA